MQRITTATRVIDLFGAGKDGFTDGPPNATELDAAWFNVVQEENARPLEEQGLALDGTFTQWITMLQSYKYRTGNGPTIENGATLLVESGGTISVASGGIVSFSDGSTVDLLGDVTIGTDATNLLTVDGETQFNEDVTLATTKTLTLTGTAKVAGGTSSRVETGTLALQVGAAAPTADGEIAPNADGVPVFYAGGLRITFGGVNGPWVGEDADQVAETSLVATTLLTTGSKVDVNGLLRIRAKGEVQRNVAGALRISLEQDQGTSTWVAIDNGGVTTKLVTSVDTSDANDWTPIQIERTFGTGTTDTFFRLKVEGLGGNTAKIRDTHLTVRRLGA